MKKILLPEKSNVTEILNEIEGILVDYNIERIRKRKVLVTRKSSLIVIKLSNKSIKVYSDINFKYAPITIWLIVGIILGIVGVIFVLIFLYLRYNRYRKSLEEEVCNLINQLQYS
jgi:H+/Cl- antiporter ClcA